MYPILFSIGAFHLYSFSIFLIIAWVVFSFVFWKLLRNEAIPEERIFDLTFYATIGTLVGARVVYILLNPQVFSGNILKMLAVWVVPGLSLWGGVVSGMMTLIFLSRRTGVRLGQVLDAVAFALPAALIPGAIGAMLDGAEVGRATKLPWALTYVGYTGGRHPLGFYEVGFFIFILVFLKFASRRAKRNNWPYGLLGIWFFILLTSAMFGLEFFKVTRLYFKGLSANQWILVGIFGETLGAFYVRGGGREKLRPAARQILAFVAGKGVAVYEKFFKRST